jgi:hypothetical protein
MGEYVVKQLVIRVKGNKKKIIVPITDDIHELIREARHETGLSESTLIELSLINFYKMAKKDEELKDYWEKVICG